MVVVAYFRVLWVYYLVLCLVCCLADSVVYMLVAWFGLIVVVFLGCLIGRWLFVLFAYIVDFCVWLVGIVV